MKLTKLIKVDNWFSRSINLERDKSSLDAVNAYVPTSTAIQTLRLILKTFNNSNKFFPPSPKQNKYFFYNIFFF